MGKLVILVLTHKCSAPVRTRGVMIPLFYGTGIGTGTLAKRIGIGTAWNRFKSGIDFRAGIGSKVGIDSVSGITSNIEKMATTCASALFLKLMDY